MSDDWQAVYTRGREKSANVTASRQLPYCANRGAPIDATVAPILSFTGMTPRRTANMLATRPEQHSSWLVQSADAGCAFLPRCEFSKKSGCAEGPRTCSALGSSERQHSPTFSRSDLAILCSPQLLWCRSLEEHHGHEEQNQRGRRPMPPKHRPTPPIPRRLEFLTRTRWLPVALIVGSTYVIWFFR